ncbi:MAG: exodeoxyribonuclease VII large subunit [Alphaproteobacteria bacterium]|nr:MAG: exodeoxyribonuclease VII large subunit [Alphaproteobacteria bacterium]
MTDAPENDTGTSSAELKVAELARAIKANLETAFGRVRVRGEISRPKLHSSGHLYLSLKDSEAVVEAVCWRGQVAKLGLKPEEGLEVIATGRLTTYAPRSQYQLVLERMEPAGLGALLKMLQERKARLAAEGLFDPDRKRPLPFLPRVIGVITSPTGAVLHDILHRLDERCPCHVLLWPVRVQGEGAAQEIAAAIQGFNALPSGGRIPRPDLLIVARGGGSVEDLMAFNEENVVRAAAASFIPLISAVGHETDVTLIDFASDHRAPTPTAAAERAVPVRAELLAMLHGANAQMQRVWRRRIEESQRRVDDWAERLATALRRFTPARAEHLAALGQRLTTGLTGAWRQARTRLDRWRPSPSLLNRNLALERQRLHDQHARLTRATRHRLHISRQSYDSCARLLGSLSYQGVLERGFVLARDSSGKVVTRAAETCAGDALSLTFHDGTRRARITE